MQPSNRRLVTEADLEPFNISDLPDVADRMETHRAYVENLVITDLGTTDGQTKALIESPTSETAGALNAAIAGATRTVAEATAPVRLRFFRKGSDILVRSPWSASRDILMPFALDGPNANGMKRTILVNASHPLVQSVDKTAPDSTVWPTVTAGANADSIQVPNDDNAPLHVENSYTGGNHGWSGGGYRVGKAGHGKTNADRGSTWTDGTRTYTLAKVEDANALLFFADTQDLNGGRSRPVIVGPQGGTLTHVAGATNTSAIAYTSSVAFDLPEVAHSRTVTASVDGRPVLDGASEGYALDIVETYTVVGFKPLVLWSRANIGDDPFAEASLKAAGDLFRLTSAYRVTAAQTIITQTMTALAPFAAHMGVTQATALQVPAGGTLRQFMPGVGTVGGFNLSTYADVTTVGGNVEIGVGGQLVAADPASRMYQWAHDSGGARKWGLALGVLPYLSGSRAARKASGTDTRGWFFSTLKKNYPQIMWSRVVAAGETFTGVAFRRYLPPEQPDEMVVDDGVRQWVLIDTPTAHATEQVASIPRAIGRTLVPDGSATVALTAPEVVGTEAAYTNTAPGYMLAEAVADAAI